MWLSPSGQVAHTTLDWRLCRTRIFRNEKSGKILPVGVIYGPNGGGKSNLLQALSCLITTVVKPIRDLEKTRERVIIQQRAECEPFLFDEESKEEPTEFRIFFRQEKSEYCYCLALKQEEIVYETLHWRTIGGKKQVLFLNVRDQKFHLEQVSINQVLTDR